MDNGDLTASKSFMLMVDAVDSAPAISKGVSQAGPIPNGLTGVAVIADGWRWTAGHRILRG
jgi:hypothetical protein